MSAAMAVNDQTFDAEVLKSTTPVLVDFWAEWCGPCRSLIPSIDALADEKAGRLKVVKVNVDESPDAPSKYGVRSIPALYIFKNGEVVAQTVGALPKSELTKWVEASI
jgi:thioredoxin 1